MSAKYDDKMGHLYVADQKSLNRELVTAIFQEFDESVANDDDRFKKRRDGEITVRRICIVKLLIFPIELPLYFLIMGFVDGKKRWQLQKDVIKFLFKKISLEQILASIIRNS